MFFVKSIKLKDIRGFKNLNIDFKLYDNKIFNNKVIIGKNGTCKTTILRCLALGLCDKPDGNGLLSENFGELISEDNNEAWIDIVLYDHKETSTEIKITTQIIKEEGKETIGEKERPNIPIFVCGYGAARCVEGPQKVREYRIVDSVYSLFQYDSYFWPRELVLRRLKDFLKSSFYPSTLKNIKKIMGLNPLKDKIEIEKGGGIYVSGPKIGKKIPIEGWADGFSMTLLWIIDLFGWALIARNLSDDGQISGILLIDEIEQHIHPSMQINILKHFNKYFPNLQIITTTHSPLVALAANNDELIVLKRKGKYVYKVSNIPDFSKYTINDIISDDKMFSTIHQNPDYHKKLILYNKLINGEKGRLTKKESNKIKRLAKELERTDYYLRKEDKILVELDKIKQKYGI